MKDLILLLLIFLPDSAKSINNSEEKYFDHDPALKKLPDDVLKNFLQDFNRKYNKTKELNEVTTEKPSRKMNKKFFEFLVKDLVDSLDDIPKMELDETKQNYKHIILNHTEERGNMVRKYGSMMCSLEEKSNKLDLSPNGSPVCPWHHELRVRENIYPHLRLFAKCNCVNCLAKTKFDSDRYFFSGCRQAFSLMPALVKRVSSQTGEVQWKFVMEKIPTACFCSIRLNPI